VKAAHKLVTSHLRLVAKVAFGYRGYGLPLSEIVSEGNVGLMQAVKKFEPDRGFRLSTYAVWWIKASIQDYVLRSWSLVKMGTTAGQKKLFFGLKRAKAKINAMSEGDLTPDQVRLISQDLGVQPHEVVDMDRRLKGDSSLNLPMSIDGDGERQDMLVDDTDNQETRLITYETQVNRNKALNDAMKGLNEREQAIFQARRLQDEPSTLEELADLYKVSRERIRQIEQRAFEKVQQAVLALSAKMA
jgi:RNA polymerase sigma-32 factor